MPTTIGACVRADAGHPLPGAAHDANEVTVERITSVAGIDRIAKPAVERILAVPRKVCLPLLVVRSVGNRHRAGRARDGGSIQSAVHETAACDVVDQGTAIVFRGWRCGCRGKCLGATLCTDGQEGHSQSDLAAHDSCAFGGWPGVVARQNTRAGSILQRWLGIDTEGWGWTKGIQNNVATTFLGERGKQMHKCI